MLGLCLNVVSSFYVGSLFLSWDFVFMLGLFSMLGLCSCVGYSFPCWVFVFVLGFCFCVRSLILC